MSEIHFDGISGHFRSIWNLILLLLMFDKMAAGAHFRCPKSTFERISGHFRSIRNFFILNFFDKMAAGGHFGCDDNINYQTRPFVVSVITFEGSKLRSSNLIYVLLIQISRTSSRYLDE